jgi:hypothetical protein
VALALQQRWVAGSFLMAPGASRSNDTQAVARPSASRKIDETTTITTTTSKPLFPPNENVGSVNSADTSMTLQVILEGMESAMEKFKKANARLMKMTCKELDEERETMDKEYEALKEQSLYASYDSAKANALKSLAIEKEKATLSKSRNAVAYNTAAKNKAAKESQHDYAHQTTLHLNVLEQYALKCGVTRGVDKWCDVGDGALNDKFSKLLHTSSDVDAKFTEAGWLRNQAVGEYATTAEKHSAEISWGRAMNAVGEVWSERASLGWGLEVTTAACGLRPPTGPWAQPRKKCNLKPSDPMMQALLRDDPKEFVRVWKEMIGKKAGLSPDKVVVDIKGCF